MVDLRSNEYNNERNDRQRVRRVSGVDGSTPISSVVFLAASSRAEMDERVLDLLEARIDDSGVPRFLYLSPTRRKNREMSARLASRRISWRPNFLVPLELADQILRKGLEQAASRVTSELKTLLILRILEEDSPEKGMEALRFKGSSTPVGVARHVVNALDTLARRGLSPRDAAAGLPRRLARDLDRVLELYQDALAEHGLSDPNEIAVLATGFLGRESASLPGPADLLVLDGFAAPERVDQDFLIALARSFEDRDIVVTIPGDLATALWNGGWKSLPPELRVFGHAAEFFRRLGLTKAKMSALCSDSIMSETEDPRDYSLSRYSDRAAEVKGIAGTIKRIFFKDASAGGLRPEDFHVLVPRIDPYYRLFIELFPRYGIPFNITRGIPLSSIPVVRLLSSLLDAVAVRDHQALFQFFSSDLVTASQPESMEGFVSFLAAHSSLLDPVLGTSLAVEPEIVPTTLDMPLLNRFCREAGVRGGRDLKRDWLGPMVRFGERGIIEARSSESPGREHAIRKEFTEVLVQLWLLSVEFDAFDRLDEDRPVEDLVGEVEALVGRYDLSANLMRSLISLESDVAKGGRIILEKNLKGFNRALKVLRETARDLKLAGDHHAGIERVRDIFRERCRREMIQEAGELAGVSVSQMLEIRNMAGPVVFVAGLTSDDFPLTPPPSFLLPQGPDSPTFAEAVDESRFLLAQVMRNSGTVIFSYPTSAGDEPLEPSPALEDLIRQGVLEGQNDLPPDDEPLSNYEILQAVGRSCGDEEPVAWDRVRDLLARHSAPSPESTALFHEDVRRALVAGFLRARPDEYGPYDGMIRDDAALGAIAGMLNHGSFCYSTSMLNEYRTCPLRFFFKHVLGLRPIVEIPEEPDAADVGLVVHDILARFYQQWRDDGRGRITLANRMEALERMFGAAQEALDSHRFLSQDLVETWSIRARIMSGLYGPSTDADDQLRQRVEAGTDIPTHRRGLLRILVDYEADVDLPLYPRFMEFPFGMDGNPPLIVRGEGGHEIRVRGRIDRIDIVREAQDSTGGTAWIFDYKTGRCPSLEQMRQGRDLQLQVYLLAALDASSHVEVRNAGACFLSLRLQGENPRKSTIFTDGISPEALPAGRQQTWRLVPEDLQGVRSDIREIDAAVRRGEFPRSPGSELCKICSFSRGCFRDEHRVRVISRRGTADISL